MSKVGREVLLRTCACAWIGAKVRGGPAEGPALSVDTGANHGTSQGASVVARGMCIAR